jgi:hypothetical protein
VITLFADDFRIIFFTSNEDFGFSILNLVCMGFFFMEVAVLSFVKVFLSIISGKLFFGILFLA